MPLGDFLAARREEIVAEWEERVRSLPGGGELSRPALRDHVPELLERIAAFVSGTGEDAGSALEGLPDLHAVARLERGYELAAAAAELSILRDVVLDRWERAVGPVASVAELRRLDRAIDETTI